MVVMRAHSCTCHESPIISFSINTMFEYDTVITESYDPGRADANYFVMIFDVALSTFVSILMLINYKFHY